MKTIHAKTIQGDLRVDEDTEAPELAKVFGKIIVVNGAKLNCPNLVWSGAIEVETKEQE